MVDKKDLDKIEKEIEEEGMKRLEREIPFLKGQIADEEVKLKHQHNLAEMKDYPDNVVHQAKVKASEQMIENLTIQLAHSENGLRYYKFKSSEPKPKKRS